jgi:hypothetical protein
MTLSVFWLFELNFVKVRISKPTNFLNSLLNSYFLIFN